jgi:hypothetical protein
VAAWAGVDELRVAKSLGTRSELYSFQDQILMGGCAYVEATE